MMDLYSDPGHGRFRSLIDSHPQVTEMIKTAEFEDNREEIPKTAFAWSSKDLYPVHTPEHAIVSYLYAKTAQEYGDRQVPKEVVAKIAEALEFYQIDLGTLQPAAQKTAQIAEGECLFPEQQTYPVRTRDEIKTAEARLFEELPKMRPETRAMAFSKLAQRAEQLGVPLEKRSYRYAGLTLTKAKDLVKELECRVAATKSASAKDGYTKIAVAIVRGGKAARRELLDREVRIKLAEAIGTLDEEGGLVGLYDRKIPDPLVTVFNSDKLGHGPMMDVGGLTVSDTEAASLPASFYADVLGHDVLAEIAPSGHVQPESLRAVVNTLPADLKVQLGAAMKSAGVGHAG
jgi:hypothetical protein